MEERKYRLQDGTLVDSVATVLAKAGAKKSPMERGAELLSELRRWELVAWNAEKGGLVARGNMARGTGHGRDLCDAERWRLTAVEAAVQADVVAAKHVMLGREKDAFGSRVNGFGWFTAQSRLVGRSLMNAAVCAVRASRWADPDVPFEPY